MKLLLGISYFKAYFVNFSILAPSPKIKEHFPMMISLAPFVYTRYPLPDGNGMIVLMDFLAELKVNTLVKLVSGWAFLRRR